ncbi:unnamed protein product [Clonostachys rosea]|uniref:NTF2 domain-containing protein n=1 Tax=Bionectria ochroleuca TaxID=29856 RepID=A0ABY6UN93_BIOOC|nr:unnamed protein product [Clonostachys rosea]
MATNGSFAHQEQYKASADQNSAPADVVTTGGSNNNLSKDQIGWIFIEQYYTTLSKTPERLHLFYHKRSQFVAGVEAQLADVSVGRQAIQERIKKLDFQDTKVRVSNVDSQASFDGIVIQVIGEVSNKAGEPKKFVQTFVLAQQPTGYFVLNDILRYIDDEDQEAQETAEANTEEAEEAAVEAEPAAEPEKPVEAASEEPSPALDVKAVEQKLEEASAEEEAPVAEEKAEAEKPATKAEAAKPDPETTAKDLAEEDAKAAEKPQDPAPSPAAKEIAQPEAAAPEPTGPPKPMTWASRAAAAAGPRPVVPLPKTATPPAQSQSRAPAPAATPAAAPAAAAAQPAAPAAQASAPAAAPAAETQSKDASGWQTAGADSKRQNRPQSISAAPADKEGTLGYVKYVTDKVQDGELKKALEAYGELAYFDINRQKNCAFVEYKTAEGLQAALGASPHSVNGEQIIVEQRRPKANTYGGNFGGGRGGSQRGRGGFDGNRNSSQGGNRGNFSGQNRGRGAPRGRGGAQANNA